MRDFGLKKGFSSETSGGILVSLAAENAKKFVEFMEGLGENAWIIGKVVVGTGKAILAENCEFFDSH